MEFKNILLEYYSQLVERFNNGFEYLENNPNDERAIRLYEDLIKETSEVERLVNYYKNKGVL